LPIRLLLLAFVTTLGSAHAADWHARGEPATGAVSQARSANPTAAIPQIINGIPTSDYPAVAGLTIWNPTDVALCTGTLVSPSVMLTAAHCVAEGPLAIDAVFFPTPTTRSSYAVIAYEIHPEFNFPEADLAVLLLEAPVVDVTPISLVGQTPRPRTQGTIVGYGKDETGRVGLKEMGTVRLKRCPRRVPALGLWRGALTRAICWRSRPSQQDTCHGDSGGPFLIGNTLAGVTSGGDPHCSGTLSWDTNVVPFLPWILSRLR
jgi:V8-like Glu-specific endopeptidase